VNEEHHRMLSTDVLIYWAKRALLTACEEIGLEANAEKSKLIFNYCQHRAGKCHNKHKKLVSS